MVAREIARRRTVRQELPYPHAPLAFGSGPGGSKQMAASATKGAKRTHQPQAFPHTRHLFYHCVGCSWDHMIALTISLFFPW
jgi:hypothetical protein